MNNRLIKYYQIFASIPEGDYDETVKFIEENISKLFIEDYNVQFPKSEILKFIVNGYTYLFSSNKDLESNNIEIEDRIIGVYGRISHTNTKRDTSRMKGFIGPFTKLNKYKDFDKGHFISHKINGSLDQNLYPQLKEINRGWSKQGKLFRSLEKYCEENPNAFVFTRPIYTNLSWIPRFIDYGIFTKEYGLLLNRFDNKKKNTTTT